ncbi:hypothetical protein F5Y05DRAFT_191179 [Hypoxylon sp. FL0543]|nr:hypothetical protein F5Y05DRAFT_191179 [Hypoxylon sp. FL0543]
MSVTSVILCGQSEELGKVFSDALKPDFEVIYFTNSPVTGLAQILAVLEGSIPTSAASSTVVGSGNLSHGAPKAVILSAPDYHDAWVEAARSDIQAAGKRLVILKPDASGYADGGDKAAAADKDKAKAAAGHALKVLRKLEDEGKLDGEDDGVYAY